MRRNLDLTALRALVAVAEYGGVTRAAHVLNLTQSAVSMQIKRLEEMSAAGEQMLAYARRMLALNDEAVARLTDTEYEGEIVLSVPYDIVYPHVPQVLQRFQAACPRMKVRLQAVNTRKAKDDFAAGAADLILTTEDHCDPGGETLTQLPLVWIGAAGGQGWRQRPLRSRSGRPSISSSRLICIDTADCVRLRTCAARVTPPYSATATSALRAVRSRLRFTSPSLMPTMKIIHFTYALADPI